MKRLVPTVLLLVSTASLGFLRTIPAADLRTTLCDRPVCRTVAISPLTEMESPPAAISSLTTEQVFDNWDSGCTGHCSDGCQQCCLPRCEMWATSDFLLGWRHSVRFPALVTSSPNGAGQATAGVLPNATIVYPTEPVGEEARPGARLAVGAWLDPCHCWGVEGRYFMLADQVTTFTLESTGDPILARPFFDVATNSQAARLLAFPGVVTPGSVSVDTESQLLGGDALLHRALCRWGCGELYFLVGYQFARLDETLVIRDSSIDADPGNLIQDGTEFEITDLFATRNEYHAASIGAVARMRRDELTCEILGKVGLGNMHETVTIAGRTDTTVPGAATVTNQFGLLAQGVNLGTFEQDKFCVSPEVNVKLTYALSRCIDVSCGYTFLYLSNVVAPGEQIDVDLRVPADRFRIRDSEYWMHAFQCGATLRF